MTVDTLILFAPMRQSLSERILFTTGVAAILVGAEARELADLVRDA